MEFSTCGILSAISFGTLDIFYLQQGHSNFTNMKLFLKEKSFHKAMRLKDEGSVSEESNRGRPLEVSRALCGQALTVTEAQGEGIQHPCKQYDTENIIAGGRMTYRDATGHQR